MTACVRRYAKDGVRPDIVDAYRLPQLVRGWEWGLLRFLRARVAGEFFSPGSNHQHHNTAAWTMRWTKSKWHTEALKDL